MDYYVRNSFIELAYKDEKIIIKGGRYNKKIYSNPIISELLLKTFRIIDEESLVASISEKSYIDEKKAKRAIKQLVKLGFIEEKNILELNQDDINQVNREKSKIKTFNIPTCMRPKALERCLVSYIEHFKKYGRDIKFYIFDDSTLEKSIENIELLKRVRKKYNVEVFYIGAKEKELFVELLKENLSINNTLLEFAFLPERVFSKDEYFKAGANRNFILAYNAGECLLMADDDSYLKGINGQKTSFKFSSGRGDITKKQVTLEGLKENINDIEVDILRWHESFLGESLEDILARKKIDKISYEMLGRGNKIFPNKYDEYKRSKVHFTFNTTLGWPDEAADDVLQKGVLNNNRRYIEGNKNEYIIENIEEDLIFSTPFLLTTTLTGIDNRNPLFPYIPVYKNEDIHYSYILNYIDPNSLSAGSSTALLHDKKCGGNQLKAFYKNFYGDIVFSNELYKLLEKIKVDVPIKYMNFDDRKILFASYMKKVCGNDSQEFVNNLIELNGDMKKAFIEKKNILDAVYDKFPIYINEYKNKESCNFMNTFEEFLKSKEWIDIRETLLLYSDLLLVWDRIMEECKKLNIEKKLPVKKL